ncbi:MAG: hypothetical protein FWJ73_08590 [Limnochordales bacterium]
MRKRDERPWFRPRKPSVPDLESQVMFDNPDDAELVPQSDSLAAVEDAETLVALDNPDDADMYGFEDGEDTLEQGL